MQLTKEPSKDTTIKNIPGSMAKDIDIPKDEIQISENDDTE